MVEDGNQKSDTTEMNSRITAIIEHDEDGYYAWCPQLEGCQSQGDTFEEAMGNIKEAVSLYLETLSDEEKKEYLSKDIVTATVDIEVT